MSTWSIKTRKATHPCAPHFRHQSPCVAQNLQSTGKHCSVKVLQTEAAESQGRVASPEEATLVTCESALPSSQGLLATYPNHGSLGC